MKNPYTQLYLHCVWATWDRLSLLTPHLEQPVYSAILTKCRELKCEPLAINGMPDHVHLLVRFHTTVSVAQLLKEVKGSSSHLVTHEVAPGEFFKWQGTYGAFTLAKSAIPEVKAYIQRKKNIILREISGPNGNKLKSKTSPTKVGLCVLRRRDFNLQQENAGLYALRRRDFNLQQENARLYTIRSRDINV